MDGSYHFELCGSDGKVYNQLVTATAFANYQVGDYFSELRPWRRLRGRRPAPLLRPSS